MTSTEILSELEKMGDMQTKKTLMKHGAKEPFFGVKVADLKKILKKTKKNHELSLEFYQTGNSDAMYLAGLMADATKITEEQLNDWVNKAYWYYLSDFTVPMVAAETSYGFELALKWIQSDQELIASAGWSTLIFYARLNSDEKLDITAYSNLLDSVERDIDKALNRVKYNMNGFVIAVGTFISELNPKAIQIAEKIGKVDVVLAGTACKVPLAKEYIQKVIDSGRVGKKLSSPRC